MRLAISNCNGTYAPGSSGQFVQSKPTVVRQVTTCPNPNRCSNINGARFRSVAITSTPVGALQPCGTEK